jgi:hypothetical protein
MPTDEQIATAFNAGYQMQKHDPKMIDNFLATDTADEIVTAITEGAKQFQKHKIAQTQKELKERIFMKQQKR